MPKFTKGQTPWNKNKKGTHFSPETEFKTDQFVGEAHPSWKGGVYVMKHDCVHEYSGKGKKIRRPRKIYEDNFGPVPRGFVVVHIDGNRYNDEPNNLMAISRGQLMKLNNPKL